MCWKILFKVNIKKSELLAVTMYVDSHTFPISNRNRNLCGILVISVIMVRKH